MKKRTGSIKTWLVFIVLLLIVFGAILFFTRMREKAEVVKEPTQVEEGVKKPSKEFAKIELTQNQKDTLDNAALLEALKGSGDCAAIEFDVELRQNCNDNLLFNEGVSKNSVKLCEQISDPTRRQECLDSVYLSLAKQTNDLQLCEEIANTVLKQRCTDQLQVALGRTATSEADCDQINDPKLRQDCLDNFYLAMSIKTVSSTECEKISDTKLRERCLGSVEKQEKVVVAVQSQIKREYVSNEEKLNTCEQLAGTAKQDCQDNVNFALALEKRDISFCNAIANNERQSQCVATQSASINKFYLKQAIASQDTTLCDKILDATLQATCKANIK